MCFLCLIQELQVLSPGAEHMPRREKVLGRHSGQGALRASEERDKRSMCIFCDTLPKTYTFKIIFISFICT